MKIVIISLPIILSLVITIVFNLTIAKILIPSADFLGISIPISIKYRHDPYLKQGIILLENIDEGKKVFSDVKIYTSFESKLALDSVQVYKDSFKLDVIMNTDNEQDYMFQIKDKIYPGDLFYCKIFFKGGASDQLFLNPNIIIRGDGFNVSYFDEIKLLKKSRAYLRYCCYVIMIFIIVIGSIISIIISYKDKIKLLNIKYNKK